MVKKGKNLELKKHVSTIHSSNNMSLLQRKIANGLLYNAYNELQTKNEYQISLKELCALIGYDSNDRKTIKKALIKLLSTVVEWNLVDRTSIDADGIWNASSIIADVSIKGSICSYSYSSKMKELLFHPTIYGRLNMVVQAKFQSSYGLALYENCIRYQNLEQTPWFELSVFRKLMGVDANKYLIFADFKRRVLDIATREVNMYSSINVQIELRRASQRVMAIRFLIKKNSESKSSQIVENSLEDSWCSNKLKIDFGMSAHQIKEIYDKYDEKYILDKIRVIELSSSFLNGKILNLAKYLQGALEKDYQPPKSSKELIIKVNNDLYIKERLTKKTVEQEERIKNQYRNYQIQEAINRLQALDQQQKDTILEDFLKSIDNSIYVKMYQKNGLSNVFIMEKFLIYAKEKRISILDKILSFDEFRISSENKVKEESGL